MSIVFSPDEGIGGLPASVDLECPCPDPDDQYLLEVDNGSVFLVHRTCGKQPRGDYPDLVEMPSIPVTVTVEPYGNCDGSEWHGEYRCDCGVALIATVNDRTVVHDDVPYLIGRDYSDRDGAAWHITESRDRDGRPLVYLLPQGAGEDCPLGQVVEEYGPLNLIPKENPSR